MIVNCPKETISSVVLLTFSPSGEGHEFFSLLRQRRGSVYHVASGFGCPGTCSGDQVGTVLHLRVLGLGAGIKGMHSHTRTNWKVLKQFTQTHMKRERENLLCFVTSWIYQNFFTKKVPSLYVFTGNSLSKIKCCI